MPSCIGNPFPVLLFRERFLFTGDHLAYDRYTQQLTACRDYCWYSWALQVESMRRLATFTFEWVLPGHGQRVWLPHDDMRQRMVRLVEAMKSKDPLKAETPSLPRRG